MAKPAIKNTYRSPQAIARFSVKMSRRGALIFGVGAGFMVWLQGLAFVASYTTDLARAKFATVIASNAGLGILYGEVRQIETPAGYMVYRTLPFLGFIGALWALSVTTRLLRGQEEDGKMEIMLTGSNSLPTITGDILRGVAQNFIIAFAICATSLIALGRFNSINVTASASIFFALGIFGPAFVFACVGALTSQLAATRRRAMVYGVVFLIVTFAMRSAGNVLNSVAWLKNLSPFGWADKMHIITGSSWLWLLPMGLVSAICLLLTFYYAKNRDLYDSIVPDKNTAKPRYKLLGGPMGLSFRLTRANLAGWLVVTIGVCALITGLAKTAVSAVGDSQSLTKALGNITGSDNTLMLAFVGFSGFMAALLIMVVAAMGISRIREDEARGYLDNFLVSSVSRTKWMTQRALLLLASITVICTLGNLTSLLVARAQGIVVPADTLMLGGLNFIGPAVLIVGFGTLIYGLVPRWTSLALYGWITWSFVIEMIGSVVTFNHYILDTSLLRHISLVPATSADWNAFAAILSVGLVAFVAGLMLFNRRDLISE